ncbi:YgcG family protein, partial [Pseudomonas aeruginosa]
MGLWQNVDRAADDSLGVLAPTLFLYALFLLPGEVLMAILSAILNCRGGGGGGASGGGGIFRGGGGSSGGGGASGGW